MVSYMKSACPVKLYRFSVFRVDVSFVLAWDQAPRWGNREIKIHVYAKRQT